MRLEDLPDDICLECGTSYQARRYDQKYCSDACREKSAMRFGCQVVREERRRARMGKTCPICRKTFDAKWTAHQKYCSPPCARRAQKDRERGKTHAEALAELRCQECGGPMPDAPHVGTLFCRPCKKSRKHRQHLEASRRYYARNRERIRTKERERARYAQKRVMAKNMSAAKM